MQNDKSRDALIKFLEYLATKGLVAKGTITARKAAVNNVFSILSNEEAKDVLVLNLPDVMSRFQILKGNNYTPGSLTTYQSRTKASLDDFSSYLENPMGFRPNLQSRSRASSKDKKNSNEQNDISKIAVIDRPTENILSPAANSILPIPIRSDLTIFVQGLPFDLSESEARKISNVVLALGSISTD